MVQTFTTNDNNDIFIDASGNLSISSGIIAVEQACATAAKAQLNEMIYAFNQGVANFETIWRNVANVAQFEASVRAALLSVAGVTGVSDFSAVVQDNQISYSATIQTIYGPGNVNG
jgi:hypothetical protein